MAPALTRVIIGIVATAHVAYLALLIVCDVLRVEPRGFVPEFESGGVVVSSLDPVSPAARLGLREGERIVRANGQVLLGEADWRRVTLHFDPDAPLVLQVGDTGQERTVTLKLSAGVAEWRRGNGGMGVLTFRLAQCVTLGLALIVAVRRSNQPSALVGALLLGALATVSLLLPMRMGVFWNALPSIVQPALWIPFTVSAMPGALLFAFATVFPRRTWRLSSIVLALVPAGGMAAWHLYLGLQSMAPLGPPIVVPDPSKVIITGNILYAAAAIALLIGHRRTATAVNDRRRIGVLVLGTGVSAAAGFGVYVGYWQNPGVPIFERPTMAALSLVFLAMPASFAYAILRHRLFDVPLIVRQGVRYALARRMVDALVPLLGVVLALDILIHRQQSVGSLLGARGWFYLLVTAALLLVRRRREEWLRRLDRRFFRERYDAQRVLAGVADQVDRASNFEAVAPSIGQQIEEALHPTFVSVLRRLPSGSSFASDSGHIATEPVALPTSLTVIRVLAVLRKPLALSLGDTAWVRHQLPIDERSYLVARGIELLVPISGPAPGELPLGLLVLGPRRSEEPFNPEDLELLTTIADAIGALLERSSQDVHSLAECDACGRCFDIDTKTCPVDGQALHKSNASRLINARYRLESRLGRGGMGTVYAGLDTVLEREVAVKVIRDGIVSPLDLGARFLREARLAAGFTHPNVVRVYDFGTDPAGRPFLVMELLEGQTLREHLARRGALPGGDVLQILRGVCGALDAAHQRGLVHRDLKPENIFLQRQSGTSIPKVLDFGLAKMLASERSDAASTEWATSAGVLVGTLDYMAPEQVAGGDVSPSWDIWAVGVITYEMLTSEHPFKRTVVLGYGADESGATAAGSSLPPGLETFFRRVLSHDAADRPQSAAAFLAESEEVLT